MVRENEQTLLFVEDDLEIVEDVSFLLKEYFYKIIIAVDGESALDKYFSYKPDIVLLDINIPKINGLEVAKKIREKDESIPILFLSAYSDREKLMSAINIGVSSYIVKPLKVQELIKAITKIIHQKSKNDKVNLANGFVWSQNDNILSYKKTKMILTKKEFQLMELFSKNRETFFSACDIATEIFSDTAKVTNDGRCNNIVQLLSRFKNKVLKNFDTEEYFILNVYGLGYKLI